MTTPPITIRVNGDHRQVEEGSTLLDLVAEVTGHALGGDGRRADGGRLGVAAAVDGFVVPRGRWADHPLAPDADVEVVTAVQGG